LEPDIVFSKKEIDQLVYIPCGIRDTAMEVESAVDDAKLKLRASDLVAEIQSYLLVKNSSTNQLERYGICTL
jgi:hypothetical protein